MALAESEHKYFRLMWSSANVSLGLALVLLLYAGGWEFSVRQYLRGFSDAVVPAAATSEEKAEAILAWMRVGPQRNNALDVDALSQRDPETTLNYRQLLAVCGTATNAFLNLSRSAGLSARRLLLLNADGTVKHVVAEVLIDGRWVIADPSYRVLLRDSQARLVTRSDLQDPQVFAQATRHIPNYLRYYSYEHVAHVRVSRLPLNSFYVPKVLSMFAPGWDEATDWSLLLERESFFVFFIALTVSLVLFFTRTLLAWYADTRLGIQRFRLRDRVARVGTAFFSSPELK